jgi:hypothetical protein
MTAFIPATRDALIKHLLDAGFTNPCTINRYSFMIKDGIRLCIPGLEHQEIGKELSHRILKQAGLKTD